MIIKMTVTRLTDLWQATKFRMEKDLSNKLGSVSPKSFQKPLTVMRREAVVAVAKVSEIVSRSLILIRGSDTMKLIL